MAKGYHDTWVGVDLDGTLAHHDGVYKGDDHVGAPIKPMVDRVKQMLEDGIEVRIFTARRPHPAIRRFCKEQFGKVLKITNTKDPGMIAFYDDRAVSIKRNKGVPFSEEAVEQAHEKSK